MKRIFTLVIAILAFVFIPCSVLASEIQQDTEEKHYLDDGSYYTVTIDETSSRSSKTASKTYEYHSSSGDLLWKVQVRGTFTYNGTSSACTSASHTITIYNDSWYTYSQTSYASGNEAIAKVTMKRKTLGIVTATRSVNLTLSCDENGNLS